MNLFCFLLSANEAQPKEPEQSDILSFLEFTALKDANFQYERIIQYLKQRGHESHSMYVCMYYKLFMYIYRGYLTAYI